MTPRVRNILLTVLGLAVVTVLIVPRMNFGQSSGDNNSSQQQTQQSANFATTPNPADAYERALADDKPLVVEFYADW